MPEGNMPLFGKDNLPAGADPALGGHPWAQFRKVEGTKAMRIEGPFKVITIHGGNPQECVDGYLAVDNQGHPYPIDRSVIEAGFVPVEEAVPEAAVGPPEDGWRGEEPHEGTRRRLVRDTILATYVEANPGEEDQVREEIATYALELADRIEAALLAVEPAQTAPVD